MKPSVKLSFVCFWKLWYQKVPNKLANQINLLSHVEAALNDEEVSTYLDQIRCVVREFLDGKHGKAAQFWMQYVNMAQMQLLFHYLMKTNNFSLRFALWEKWLPFCFATNRLHYARYGSYYVKFLKHLEHTHPGATEELEEFGLSVRRNSLGICQAVDLAGEKTYMKKAKTAGDY